MQIGATTNHNQIISFLHLYMFSRLAARAAAPALLAAAGATTFLAPPTPAFAHGNHEDHSHGNSDHERLHQLEQTIEVMRAQLKAQFDVKQFTGQGNAVFSWESTLTGAFPDCAKKYEKDLHGGFSEDSATGVVYTGIPNYGLCTISPDLKTWTKIGTDPRLKDNCHGICVFKFENQTFVALAQNEKARILICQLDGTVLQELTAPSGGEFNFDEANGYYSKKTIKQLPWDQIKSPAFAVTDVTFLNGKLYAVTGYCDGDFVLTASFNDKTKLFEWGPTAWGGKDPLVGTGKSTPGKFQTAHGERAKGANLLEDENTRDEVREMATDTEEMATSTLLS